MYSYKERVRAVKLYIKLGKRLNVTIRQLGYPTKNSLVGWYREYIQDMDLRAGYRRSTQRYSTEQKVVAVQHFLDNDRCIAFTLKALGYPCRETLEGWIDELHPKARKRMVGRAPNVQHPPEIKYAAVIELCSRQTSAQTIAQKHAVCRPTLYNWKNQLLGPEAPTLMDNKKDRMDLDLTRFHGRYELLY